MSMIGQYIAHVRAAGIFALVDGVAAYSAVDKTPLRTPACFLYLDEEGAQESPTGTGGVHQRVEADIVAAICVRNVSDKQGAAAADDIDTVRQALRARLLGFEPEGTDMPTEFVSFKILSAAKNVVWAEMVFATAYYIQEGSSS